MSQLVSVSKRRRHLPIVVSLFVFSLLLPIQIFVGPLRLSPYRIVLIALLGPCLIMWISGRVGKIRAADVLMILHTLWATIALIVLHGFETGTEPAGIYFIEVMGAYLVSRCFIRSRYDFEALVHTLFLISVILIPLTALESIAGIRVFNKLVGAIATAPTLYYIEPRLGMDRAYGPFSHPILYGVFCASILGLAYYVLGRARTRFAAALRAGLVAIATFFSLSSGPFVALAVQFILMIWNRVTRRIRRRWALLGVGIAIAYVIVDLYSNRAPLEVFISYLTFNVHNSYVRIAIWDYGTAELMRNPVFGIGFNDWVRPYWMGGSIDNFWLVMAIRSGFPGVILFAAAMVLLCFKIGGLRQLDPIVYDYRMGWLISVIGVAIAGGTVHLWDAVFCYFIFLLGSGVWMLDQEPTERLASSEFHAKSDLGRQGPARMAARGKIAFDVSEPIQGNRRKLR